MDFLKAAFPNKCYWHVIGFCFLGFFEGFTSVFASAKINEVFHAKNLFFRPAPIAVVVLNIVIHAAIGQIIDLSWISGAMITYMVVIIPELTGNSLGSMFVFLALWNAI